MTDNFRSSAEIGCHFLIYDICHVEEEMLLERSIAFGSCRKLPGTRLVLFVSRV